MQHGWLESLSSSRIKPVKSITCFESVAILQPVFRYGRSSRVWIVHSWASLEPFSVILSGGQPKMYWWLYCTGASKSHEIAHICCQTQGQPIQWKIFSVWWQCIDLELTPSEIYAWAHWFRHSVNIYIELCFRKIHKKSFPDINQACF